MDKPDMPDFANLNIQFKTDGMNEYRGFLLKFNSKFLFSIEVKVYLLNLIVAKKQKTFLKNVYD